MRAALASKVSRERVGTELESMLKGGCDTFRIHVGHAIYQVQYCKR